MTLWVTKQVNQNQLTYEFPPNDYWLVTLEIRWPVEAQVNRRMFRELQRSIWDQLR